MARKIREEIVDDDVVVERAPRTRRVVTERRSGGYGGGYGMNPIAMVIAGVLLVFILVLVFGYLL